MIFTELIDAYLLAQKEDNWKAFAQLYFDSPVVELRIYNNNICNLHCNHCYYGFKTGEEKAPNLTDEQWFELFDEAVEYGITHFHFSGKEPFATKNIFTLTDYLKSLKLDYPNITWDVISNGTLIKKNAEAIKRAGFTRVCLSVDSFGQTQVRTRQALIDALTTLKDLGIPIHNFVDCHKHNKDEIFSTILTLHQQYGVDDFYFRPVVPIGNATDKTFLLDAEEYYRIFEDVHDFVGWYPVTIDFYMPRLWLVELKNKSLVQAAIASGMYTRDGNFQLVNPQFSQYGSLYLIPVMYYPAYRDQATITSDGFVIGGAYDTSLKDYDKVSPGRVTDISLARLIEDGKIDTFDAIRWGKFDDRLM